MLGLTTDGLIKLSPYVTALVAALAGSLHCAGMCGPLRLLCAEVAGARWKYQLGRGVAYGALGSLAGGIGFVLPFWALLLLVFTGLAATFLNLPSFSLWSQARRRILLLGSANPFLLGLSSGLLPCGLLHGWLVAAAASGRPLHGALLLGMLWLGSLPALEFAPILFRNSFRSINRRYPLATKLALIGIALFPLALRMPQAMSSPKLGTSLQSTPNCHAAAEPRP